MYLQQLLKVNKEHLPKNINTDEFIDKNKPIEHKKPKDDLRFQLEEKRKSKTDFERP